MFNFSSLQIVGFHLFNWHHRALTYGYCKSPAHKTTKPRLTISKIRSTLRVPVVGHVRVFFRVRVLAVESSNEISEDCFYDFVARGDLWYNDSTRDLVVDLGAACMSCASKSPLKITYFEAQPPKKIRRGVVWDGQLLKFSRIRFTFQESSKPHRVHPP